MVLKFRYYSLCQVKAFLDMDKTAQDFREIRPLGQAVKTPPFHGGNRVSIPLGVTIFFLLRWEHSSAGRASALQAEGHRFDPCCSHHYMAQWLSWLECRPVTPEVEGSSPFWVAISINVCWCGSRAEQLICNQQVVSSILTTSSIELQMLSQSI